MAKDTLQDLVFFGDKLAYQEPSKEHGIKTIRLARLAKAGLPIPACLSLSPGLCENLGGKSPKKSAQKELQQGLEPFTKAQRNKHSQTGDQPALPSLMIARLSAPCDISTDLPFVQGLGLNLKTVEQLETLKGTAFAHYHFQRFIIQYSSVVWDIEDWIFEDMIYDRLGQKDITDPADFDEVDWRTLTTEFLRELKVYSNYIIPETLTEQCVQIAHALSLSWHSATLELFRSLHNIPDQPRPAVLLQSFHLPSPNAHENVGQCFTRHPSTGAQGLYGHVQNPSFSIMENISPERTQSCTPPQKLGNSKKSYLKQLEQMSKLLETEFHSAVNLDFIYENNTLWLLNAEPLITNINATIKIACDQVDEGLISKAQAINNCDPASLSHFLHHSLKADDQRPLLTALPASLGASYGKVALDRHTAQSYNHAGENVILVRPETDPEDVHTIRSVSGVLTSQGGNSSHAAVIARSMGCPAVVGAKEIIFTRNQTGLKNISFAIGDHVFRNGDMITIDGQNGTVYAGKVPLAEPIFPDDLNRILGWADELATMKVRANADSLEETQCALNFGAQGIGLCRTEHMLLTPQALFHFRRVLLENDSDKKSAALNDILLDQKSKITGLFEKLSGLPVTIRLLDPPLHEFLPKDMIEIEALAIVLERPATELAEIVKSLEEKNPMLGHRGCRLAITLPELLDIQTRAILEAAWDVHKAGIALPQLEIMIPFVMLESEVSTLVARIKTLATHFCSLVKLPLNIHIGTMIEIPRAALRAQTIAKHTDFFSFGTNDLTQTVWGLSRDDGDSFLQDYYANKLLGYDPFKTLDTQGVGSMIAQACISGKNSNPDLTLGICGEHGADPASISFFQSLGLDYVSCSPFQVPIARLAAGQAATQKKHVSINQEPDQIVKAP